MLEGTPGATARDLMTPDPDARHEETAAPEAVEWLDRNQYEQAPVTDGDAHVGFVEVDRLRGATGPLREHAEPLTMDRLITPETPFGDVVTALVERPCYFLGAGATVDGVLTRADLNKPAAYVHLYARLYEFETGLRDHVARVEADWTAHLADDQVTDIADRARDQRGLELDRLHYASLRHLCMVAQRSDAVRSSLGYDDESAARRDLGRVVRLRNDVAHPKAILHSETTDRFAGRDVVDLEADYRLLTGLAGHLDDLTPGAT